MPAVRVRTLSNFGHKKEDACSQSQNPVQLQTQKAGKRELESEPCVNLKKSGAVHLPSAQKHKNQTPQKNLLLLEICNNCIMFWLESLFILFSRLSSWVQSGYYYKKPG
ncbi:hypothetical protein ABE29_19525 [Cytobacillus firmus]|nr:hypothetical protein [Cytobacillus firmus]MBG9546520.1 hypothetical protein [Cytobacillus firmus]MBG9554177.1 hypothetical protein [Cytobacillus firmus]MBG9557155.1 hypothetical protein [Cytobacillus firmus]MBG9576661.1 hypothetical protein [Cytobacillus firmus]